MRFYLLDRVIEIAEGESISGIKCWSLSEDVFNDHFPGFPVVPGVLVTESMAQLMGLLLEKSYHLLEEASDSGVYAMLGLIHKAKFREMIIPGDQTILKGTISSYDIYRGTGHVDVFVENKKVASADLSFNFVPKELISNPALEEQRVNYSNFILKGDKTRNLVRGR